ncbi:MAG: F0F1 ATP synthase subunit alpha [Anaerolineae bacterium]|jgi:F-type H+-transporting ATPase subunit alpha
MSERRSRPNVAALLRALHQKTESWETQAQLEEADLVRRISDEVAGLPGLEPAEPQVETLIQRLTDATEQRMGAVRFYDVGTVQHIGDSVATLSGLPSAGIGDLVTFGTGVQGLILNLDHARIDVILLGPDTGIQGGDLVTSAARQLQVPAGHKLLGRVVDPLGRPQDQKGPIEAAERRPLEREAPDIVERAPVQEPLHTGVKVIDALVPIGRGQRELILGDRQTGKTTLAVDAILNQGPAGISCVYVAIGQKKSTTLQVIRTLREWGAMEWTTVVLSGPDDPPALRYLAPYAGCAMAEFLMDEGRDVLIVFDDLSKHADAYRELSLLLRRPPGREAYPGDIFYIHARLLERACKLSDSRGGGSLTALPIIETQRGNVSAYIPTNLISICDGQIVLDADLFNRGIKPAVSVGESVSRVGGEAQTDAMRAVAGELKLALSQYQEVAEFARFGAQVGEATRRQIRRGERLRAALKQPVHQPLSMAKQIVVLLAAGEGHLDDLALDRVVAFERQLLIDIEETRRELLQEIERTGELNDEVRAELEETIRVFRAGWFERKME